VDQWLFARFTQRRDFTPAPEQLERGLTDHLLLVRQAFYERTDYLLTEEQATASTPQTNNFLFGTRENGPAVVRSGAIRPPSRIQGKDRWPLDWPPQLTATLCSVNISP